MARKLTKAEATAIKAKWDAEDPLLHYVPPVTLARASESKSRYICVHAPNQCLGANSEVYDPVAGISRRVGDIDSPFHVYAWDEHAGQMKIAQALTPERFEMDDIYEVTLSNGLRFEASLGHRVLCADGRWLALSQVQPGCELYRPPSTLDNGQLIHVADGLRSTQTFPDSQSDCHPSLHSGDAQPQSAASAAQASLPSQGGVPPHTLEGLSHASARVDAQACKLEYSYLYLLVVCFFSLDVWGWVVGLVAVSFVLPLAQGAPQHSGQCQSELPQVDVEAVALLPSLSSGQLGEVSVGFSSYSLRIVSLKFLRLDYKYDFEVPQYSNYAICGALVHNCGKTAWMQYVTASVLRNKSQNWINVRPIRVLLVIPSRAQAADVWGNRLLRACTLFGAVGKYPWIPERDIKKVTNSHSPAGPYPSKIVMKNGNELIVILSGVPNSWKALEGMTFDMVIRDEVAGTENLGDEIQPRLLASRTRTLGGLQPWGGVMLWSATETKYNEEWLAYKQRCLDGVADHVYFKPEPEEAAAYISMAAREEMRKSMSEKSYRIRGAGSLDAGDLVRIFVNQWDDKRHMLKADYQVRDDDNIMIGWDPGVHHPTGIVICALTREQPNQLKVVKCFRHTNETTDFDVECIHSFLLGRKIAGFVYDWAAKAAHKHAPSLLHALIASMDAKGYVPMAGYIQADKRVEPGIDSVRSYLNPNSFDLTVAPLLTLNQSQESGCQMLRSEIMGYCKTEPTGTSPGKVVKKNDDVMDCLPEGTLIATEFGEVPIERVVTGTRVWTRQGLRRVTDSWCSSEESPIVSVTVNGVEIHATPGHLVWTEGDIWKRMDTLTASDTLLTCQTSLSSKALNITRAQAILSDDSGTAKENCSTVTSGSPSMDRFNQEWPSTISTAIAGITKFPIWSACCEATTPDTIQPNQNTLNTLPESALLQRHGTHRQKDSHGTQKPQKKHTQTEKCEKQYVNNAVADLRPSTQEPADFVRTHAKAAGGEIPESTTFSVSAARAASDSWPINTPPKAGAAPVRKSCPAARVYDLTVEGAHEFFANGVLVHNCLRYTVRTFPSWHAAHRCGAPKFEVSRPMESAPSAIPKGNIIQTMDDYRAELSRKLANRNRRSVVAEYSWRPRRPTAAC